jgi:hypothetical protein
MRTHSLAKSRLPRPCERPCAAAQLCACPLSIQLADFTHGLKKLGIDTTAWRHKIQEQLSLGVRRLQDVIPDDDTRAAFLKFTAAVKQNVDNRATILQKLQADNPTLVGRVKDILGRVSETVDVGALKATTGKWLVENEDHLSGLKEDLVGLYKDVTTSDEFGQLKGRSADMLNKAKSTEQATRLLEHGKELLASDRARQLLDTTADRAAALTDQEIDLDGRLHKVMESNVMRKVMETGSKLLENEQVREALSKSTATLAETGGSQVTDAVKKGRALIQSTRENKTTQKVIKHGVALLEQHGDTLLQKFEGVDVDSMIEKGKGLFSDPVERHLFLNSVKDMAMEFLIRQLPSVQIPAIEGISDRLQFGIDNLDLSAFVIRKEDVHIKLGEFQRTGNLFEVVVGNISASMRDFAWLFHQHYFPDMRGTGAANADIGDGTIRLGFGVCRVTDEAAKGGFIPRLVVNQLEVGIKELQLKFFDSKMSGIINLLSSLFKDTIRRRLTETLANQLATQLDKLLGRVNDFATRYIPMFLQYFQVDMSHLPLGSKNVNVLGLDSDPEYSIFFMENGPLGFSLQLHKESPTDPTSAVVLKSTNPRIKEGHFLVAWQGARDKRRTNVVVDETLTSALQLQTVRRRRGLGNSHRNWVCGGAVDDGWIIVIDRKQQSNSKAGACCVGYCMEQYSWRTLTIVLQSLPCTHAHPHAPSSPKTSRPPSGP